MGELSSYYGRMWIQRTEYQYLTGNTEVVIVVVVVVLVVVVSSGSSSSSSSGSSGE